MSPLHAAAGAVVVSAFLGGAWLGRSAVKADWQAEREQQSRAQAEFLARNYVSRSVAEAQYQAMAARSAQVLEKVIHVPAEPLECPPDTDVRDVLIPGMADRLRVVRDTSGLPTRPDVGAVQSGAAAPADDRAGY